jgi:DedD protein
VLDQNIKQRLIGAAVLIGIGITTIPLLLRQPTEVALQLESRDHYETNPEFSSAIEISPDRRQEEAAFVSTVKLLSEEEHNKQNLLDFGGYDQNRSPQASSKKLADFTHSGSIKKEVGWLIQVGSFSHKENAVRLHDKVISSGYKAFIETVQQGTKMIYKVRVTLGPERKAADARELKRKLEHQLETKIFIIPPSNG